MDARAVSVARTNDPRALEDAGNGLFYRMGYTIVWSGWDPDAPRTGNGLAMKPVIATNGGAPIVRVIRDEIVVGTRDREETDGTSSSPRGTLRLTHEAATLDPAASRLTVRRNEKDARREIPAARLGVGRARARSACCPPARSPSPARSTNFTIPRRIPGCYGVGLAATRDLLSFLRYEKQDSRGNANPARGPMATVLGFGSSQSGRFLRDFVRDGFNQDESSAQGVRRRARPHRGRGRRLPERGVRAAGAHQHPARGPHVSGERVSVLHRAHDRPGDGQDRQRCCATTASIRCGWRPTLPPSTGRRARRCSSPIRSASATSSCPRTRAATSSPAPSTAAPRGCAPRPGRASTRAIRTVPTRRCARCSSRSTSGSASGKAPPASRTPTLKDGTLASVDKIVFPPIPGTLAARRVNEIGVLRDWVKPEMDMSKPYRPLVPQIDRDGNEIAGILLPEIAVPLATHTGWNLYKAPLSRGRAVRPLRHLRPVRRDARRAGGETRPARLARGALRQPCRLRETPAGGGGEARQRASAAARGCAAGRRDGRQRGDCAAFCRCAGGRA